MAQILPLHRDKPHLTVVQSAAKRDPFDVVTFLDHFLETDDYPDAIVSHFSPATLASTPAKRPHAHTSRVQLTMQYGTEQLAISLGGS